MTKFVPRLARMVVELRDDQNGLALIEFALAMPLVLAVGLYGAEAANLALCNLRVGQIALNLADNASRVGATPLATQQLREIDLNDILQGARLQGASIDLSGRGRIIVSSLENVQQSYDVAPIQRIHWQRCIGVKGNLAADNSAENSEYNSHYGTVQPAAGTDNTLANAGTPMPLGMGDRGSSIVAPINSAVVFVEINYNYRPLVAGFLVGSMARIHYTASFVVRDSRDFSQLYNPATAPTTPRSTCDKYTA